MPRSRSSVTGVAFVPLASPTQTLRTPSTGAKKAIRDPSGDTVPIVLSGLPNSTCRGTSSTLIGLLSRCISEAAAKHNSGVSGSDLAPRPTSEDKKEHTSEASLGGAPLPARNEGPAPGYRGRSLGACSRSVRRAPEVAADDSRTPANTSGSAIDVPCAHQGHGGRSQRTPCNQGLSESGRRESNPRSQLGKPPEPAVQARLHGACARQELCRPTSRDRPSPLMPRRSRTDRARTSSLGSRAHRPTSTGCDVPRLGCRDRPANLMLCPLVARWSHGIWRANFTQNFSTGARLTRRGPATA